MDPATLDASALSALIRSRKLSAVEATRATLDRIDRLNPGLNAIVQRMDDQALRDAAAIDGCLAQGGRRRPARRCSGHRKGQHRPGGICHDQWPADPGKPHRGRGQPARRQPPPRRGRDRRSHQHSRLQPALVHPQFILHGATRNPAFPGLTPGGSSGGAAAACAAGLGPIAHGTDIAGSIRYPAYACGIHGLRPGLGRVAAFNATAGDRLIGGQLMAVSGPLARSAADLRLGLAALSQPDPRDPWWTPAPPPAPYARRAALALAPDGLATAPATPRCPDRHRPGP